MLHKYFISIALCSILTISCNIGTKSIGPFYSRCKSESIENGFFLHDYECRYEPINSNFQDSPFIVLECFSEYVQQFENYKNDAPLVKLKTGDNKDRTCIILRTIIHDKSFELINMYVYSIRDTIGYFAYYMGDSELDTIRMLVVKTTPESYDEYGHYKYSRRELTETAKADEQVIGTLLFIKEK